ncbi:MAG TPA: tetratricopeptide repeat protein [Sphingobium sp.]|uniref:O-linked N-acetylglucosamine transferase, SPINDLY family protein n=1 Tax=Sphingobium sp. TaxID=1912891 RepID=UPI002ED19FFF
MNAGLETVFLKAKRAEHRGDAAEARRLLEEVLGKYPNNRRARTDLDRLDQRRAGSRAELALMDELAILQQRKDHAAILDKASQLVERFPRNASLWNMIGSAYLALKDNGQAEKMLRVAIQVDPDHLASYISLSEVLMKQNRLAEAEDACRGALALDPELVDAHHRLGQISLQAKEYPKAVDSLMKAITLQPDHFGSIFTLGHALLAMNNYADALDVYYQATLVDPGSATAFVRYGDLLRMTGKLDRAQAALTKACVLQPGNAFLKANLLSIEGHMCDWHARSSFAKLPTPQGEQALQPFIALPFEDDPATQLARSHAIAEASYKRSGAAPVFPKKQPGEKIRIGYFSADFHEHATLFLMSGLLREHDRDRFEIQAYSFGALAGPMREKVMPFFDAFTEIKDLTDAQAVELARQDALDIAVDLKGYTTDSRMELFAERMAPVQIAYLGYPGSVGGDFMDYIIADSIVIPEGHEQHYSERVLRIPGSYQANDNRRAIGTCPDDRTALGLPEKGFVFCSFNKNYKTTPREYDIWMRLLNKVEGSVLWMFKANQWAEDNLRKEALARGIDPERLIFADKMEHADHLARHRHADLFLDTFAVNAHTTASDALWGGLPVLTLAGQQFAARVAASLLHAIDLPELITTTEAEYEAKALDLALSPEKLAALRARLAANRLTTPLFDTVAHTRRIEAAYEAAHRRWQQGLAPDHITIA